MKTTKTSTLCEGLGTQPDPELVCLTRQGHKRSCSVVFVHCLHPMDLKRPRCGWCCLRLQNNLSFKCGSFSPSRGSGTHAGNGVRNRSKRRCDGRFALLLDATPKNHQVHLHYYEELVPYYLSGISITEIIFIIYQKLPCSCSLCGIPITVVMVDEDRSTAFLVPSCNLCSRVDPPTTSTATSFSPPSSSSSRLSLAP
jgi:hypothetical protein